MGAREEAAASIALLDADPHEYLRQANERIDKGPVDGSGYYDRHYVWLKWGQPERALEDLRVAVDINPSRIGLKVRGQVYMMLGHFHEAKTDFLRGQALDPKGWREIQGDIAQAYCHAKLGEGEAALAICEAQSNRESYWYGGILDLKGGGKADLIEGIKRILATARGEGGSTASGG